MPVDREAEICQKALELLSDLCSKGEVQNENCLDFIYYFRDLARPRYSESGALSCWNRETGRKVLGVSSGRRKEDKETWWWNEEVQDSVQRKRLAKKKWDMDRTEENRQEYKELQHRVKREVSKAKQKAYGELYTRLDTREGEKDLYRLARQRDRDGNDVQQVRVIKDRDGRVLTNLEKAYDRVPREELWYCMRKSGVAEKYVRVVQDMYERSRTVVSENREQVEENLERWRFALERRGMKVSRSKTEYMCVNEREGSGTVRLQGEEVKKVQEFKYLGSTVQSNGECGKEVKKRVQADVSVSLLSLVVTACGLALFGVSLFVSWKLCWIPWRERGDSPGTKEGQSEHPLPPPPPLQPQPIYTEMDATLDRRNQPRGSVVKETTVPPTPVSPPAPGSPPPVPVPETALKISHTSPDIAMEAESKAGEDSIYGSGRMQRQITDPSSTCVRLVIQSSIRRHMNQSNPDFMVAQFQRQDSLTGMSLGRLKPELYKQRSLDSEENRSGRGGTCGRLHFILKYDCDLEQLIVKIHRAQDLPAKDFSGTSDPYVKIYLLPDRKTKHQTKVHRKTLNPVFDEVFLFPVEYAELPTRKLHFTVYDFDRFSRHDIIGQVVVDNFLDLVDFPRETKLCRDIQYVSSDNVDLGDLMFSLCYLPTAGRLTITVIKARNLKAMDITGASDPYVKVSLMCEGRRLKKRKTSTKRNTLNPVYNEAIVFDVPPENIDQISLLIAVMDYDRVGHNEVIGVCRVGNDSESLGRDHWNEMLTYPRKPIARWHPLIE
ncbi:hypothetical protein QTP86_023803, partial [Hemibagrus guttatus]